MNAEEMADAVVLAVRDFVARSIEPLRERLTASEARAAMLQAKVDRLEQKASAQAKELAAVARRTAA